MTEPMGIAARGSMQPADATGGGTAMLAFTPVPPKRWQASAGFSLLEALITLLLLTMFMGMVFTMTDQIRDYQTRINVQSDSQQKARLAVHRIADAVRIAGSDPSHQAFVSPEDGIVTATATTLRLRQDLPHDVNDNGNTWDVRDLDDDGDTRDDNENENGDGILNDPGEDITFTFDAGARTLTLTDNVTGDTLVLVDGIVANPDGAPVFAYELDDDGDVIAVEIRITAESDRADAVTGEAAQFTASTSVYPRMIQPRVLDSIED